VPYMLVGTKGVVLLYFARQKLGWYRIGLCKVCPMTEFPETPVTFRIRGGT
jgi:hypothetical protein